MLPTSLVKEDLSLAYVMAVAASAGFSTEITRRDLDSVDVRICGKGRLAADVSLLSPEVCLQLKASSVERGDGSTFTFDLPIKNYDELRGERVVPRRLVVYELPSERER